MINEAALRDKYRNITLTLIDKKLQISTMESATSGTIASLITDTEGSSAVLKGSFITYSNEIKVKCGVPQKTIDEYGVYSKETSSAMALAARDFFHSDISIGVTGTFGNIDPNNSDSIPGSLYFSINIKGTVYNFHYKLSPSLTRLESKYIIADYIADKLIALIN